MFTYKNKNEIPTFVLHEVLLFDSFVKGDIPNHIEEMTFT
jgi:hypothetical protein